MSKIVHVEVEGELEFLLLTTDMTTAEVKERLLELKGVTDPFLWPILTESDGGALVPIENIPENEMNSPYVLRVMNESEYRKACKVSTY